MEIHIDDSISHTGMGCEIGLMHFNVEVSSAPPGLVTTMQEAMEIRRQEMVGQAASSDPVIASVRQAFKLCGKDPSRYRPSSEALVRRAIAGKDLYRINNVVDCGNVISLMTGVPLGCYDSDKIAGTLTLRVGKPGETYQGINRSPVNLEGLPLLADDAGPFGSAYGDSGRTAITEHTKQVTLVVYGLNVERAHVTSAGQMADTLFRQFCQTRKET